MNLQHTSNESFPKNRWWIAVTLLAASFMSLVDVTIVNVALPEIQTNLNASNAALEWVVVAYVLCFAVGLVPSGRLGDAYGRKKLFVLGVVGFAISSLICGLAPNVGTLVFGRAMLGFTAAMLSPQVTAILHVTFPKSEKQTVFGVFGAIASLGAVAGNILGGLIIDLDFAGLNWRPIFLVNVPIGIAILSVLKIVPTDQGTKNAQADLISITLFAVATFGFIFPFIEGRNFGWPLWLALSPIVAAAIFVRRQFSRAQAKRPELIPVALLKNFKFLQGLLLIVLFFSGLPGMFLILAIVFQTGAGMSPLQSGLATAPFPIAAMIKSFLAPKLFRGKLNLSIAVGAMLLSAGSFWLQRTMANHIGEIDILTFSAPLVVAGIGLGTAVTALFPSILSQVSRQDAGAGSGVLQTFHQIGAALSIAFIGQLFFPIAQRSSDLGGISKCGGSCTSLWRCFLRPYCPLAAIRRRYLKVLTRADTASEKSKVSLRHFFWFKLAAILIPTRYPVHTTHNEARHNRREVGADRTIRRAHEGDIFQAFRKYA